MNGVTAIWSAMIGASLVLGIVHLFVWSQNRRSWANLCFCFTLIGVLGLAAGDLGAMYASSPDAYGQAIRWTHPVYAIGVIGSLGLVHVSFRTGTRWLLALAIGLRVLVVVANFTTGANLQFTVIHSLRQITFLGEQVSTLSDFVPSPWAGLGLLASAVQLVYVLDASVRLWRTRSHDARRRALLVGGAFAFFIILAVGQVALVTAGVLRMPFTVTLPFLGLGTGDEL